MLQRQAMNSQAPTFEPGTDYIATFLARPQSAPQQPLLTPQGMPAACRLMFLIWNELQITLCTGHAFAAGA